MAIIGTYGEDICFVIGNINVSTNPAYCDSNYSRCSLQQVGTGTMESEAFDGGEVTSAWLHTLVYWYGPTFAGTPKRCIGLCKSGGTFKGIYFGAATGDITKLGLFKFDGTTLTELAAEEGSSVPTNVKYQIDMEIVDYGTSNEVNLYVNGNLVLTSTASITISGVSGFDCVCSRGELYYMSLRLSEVIVADEDTRSMRLVTLAPNGVGSTNSWTGGYTNCDEETLSDLDYIYTNADALDFQCAVSGMPSGTYSINAVCVRARAGLSADAAISGLSLGIKSGSTISVTTAQSVTISWNPYSYLMSLNPVTGDAFTQDEVNALEIDLRSAT